MIFFWDQSEQIPRADSIILFSSETYAVHSWSASCKVCSAKVRRTGDASVVAQMQALSSAREWQAAVDLLREAGSSKRLLRLAMWQWSRRLVWGVHVSEVHVAGLLPESEVEPDSAQYALDSFGFRLRCPPCFQANLLKSATSDLFDMDFTTLQKLQKYSEVAFGLLRPRSGYLVSRLRDFQNPSNTKHSGSSSPKIGRTATAWLCQSCNACWGRGDIQHFGKRLGEAGPG
jgi:hypothetical protein